jgi:hypothetical protein
MAVNRLLTSGLQLMLFYARRIPLAETAQSPIGGLVDCQLDCQSSSRWATRVRAPRQFAVPGNSYRPAASVTAHSVSLVSPTVSQSLPSAAEADNSSSRFSASVTTSTASPSGAPSCSLNALT